MSSILDMLDEAASKATPGPYFVASDDATDVDSHIQSGLSLVDTGRVGDWPVARLCETPEAEFIAACSPERIRALVACIRAADEIRHTPGGGHYDDARHAYDAAREQLEALK